MPKFFRICGIIFFLGCVLGFCLVFSSAGSGSLADALAGLLISFLSCSLGLLFIYAAELLERVKALEEKAPKKPTEKDENNID